MNAAHWLRPASERFHVVPEAVPDARATARMAMAMALAPRPRPTITEFQEPRQQGTESDAFHIADTHESAIIRAGSTRSAASAAVDKPESPRELRRDARIYGRRAGRAAGFGHPQADRIQDLPGRVLLEKAVRRRQSHACELVAVRRRTLKARVTELPGLITKAADGAKSATGMSRSASANSRSVVRRSRP